MCTVQPVLKSAYNQRSPVLNDHLSFVPMAAIKEQFTEQLNEDHMRLKSRLGIPQCGFEDRFDYEIRLLSRLVCDTDTSFLSEVHCIFFRFTIHLALTK